MERCKARGFLGGICKTVPGTDISTCHAYGEWQRDKTLDAATLKDIAAGCKFVESGQVPPPGGQSQPPAPAAKS